MDIKSTSQSAVIRPEDENLGVGANIAYGFQHVLTMYGGIIAVPLIVGQAAGLTPAEIGLLIAASLFIGGLATLLQTIGVPFFGCQLPLVQGVSFASVATVVAIVTTGGGLPSVFGAVIALVGAYKGMETKMGAEAVGFSTTSSVVTSIILVFVLNYFLSTLLF